MDMGHTHGAAGINSASNRAFARDYWYIAIGITGLVVAVRAVNYIGAVQRYVLRRENGFMAHGHPPV